MEEVSSQLLTRRDVDADALQTRIRKAVLCQMYSNARYEFPRLDMYLSSAEDGVEKGNCGGMSTLR